MKKENYKIALDVMGGDFAPINEIQGAVEACQNIQSNIDLEITFVGKENKILSALKQFETNKLNYNIVNADEVITMSDDPTTAFKKKKNSSLYKGVELHANGYVDAFVSAGNTGAMLSISTLLLGRLKGVSRPTIASFFPTEKDHPTLVLDVGANIDCKPRFLYEFAVMGSIYATNILALENPTVGLLNIGEEDSKGTAVVLETHKLLKESNLNFIGNIEGRDILQGTADVVVCDGFTGNIILKFAESFVGFLRSNIKAFAKKSIFNSIAVMPVVPIMKKIFMQFDYQTYGGVPLLGVNGNVIIGHGKSTPLAIQNMIFRGIDLIKNDINNKIESALNPNFVSEKSKVK
jgi:glycerol-3-phosphate acyltransferase PlsX